MAPDHRQHKTNELESLTRLHFRNLTLAETTLIRSLPKGELAVCGRLVSAKVTSEELDRALEWKSDRFIRASLVRWLCIDAAARQFIDSSGIQVFGARLEGSLDLSQVSLTFPLMLVGCFFGEELNLLGANLRELNLQASHVSRIRGDHMTVKGNVFLRHGFKASGEIRLPQAKIGGDLDCSGAILNNPFNGTDGTGTALRADGAMVDGMVRLDSQFQANGRVAFRGARIGGQLGCGGALFQNPPQLLIENAPAGLPEETGVALDASMARISRGAFFTNGFRAEGEVRLDGAQIGATLDCTGGTFINPGPEGFRNTGCAFGAERIRVDGNAAFRDGFHAEGEVRLVGAQIEGDLDCSGGIFHNPSTVEEPTNNRALSAPNLSLKRNAYFRDAFQAEGDVSLAGAQITGNLECMNCTVRGDIDLESVSVRGALWYAVKAGMVSLDLMNAKVGALADAPQSWPSPGHLHLDGFSYARILGGAPRDVESRLDWLARMKPAVRQPYRHLAKLLRDDGDDGGARKVLFHMEHRNQTEGKRGWLLRIWGGMLRWTVGYGYHPGRALFWLVVLILLGWPLFWAGYMSGSMAPTDKDAYFEFKKEMSRPSPPPYYERFHAFVYSLENSVPLVKLGQVDHWQADPTPAGANERSSGSLRRFGRFFISSWFLRRFVWLQILVGWFLTTMGVAAVSGIVRTDKE